MEIDVSRIIRLIWMMVLTIWLGAAYSANEPVHNKPDWRSNLAVWTVGMAWVLLLARRLGGPLSWQILPTTGFLTAIGFTLTVCGLAFALWARYYLGRNWDAYITLHQSDKLVHTGPYAIVRHPIYTGFMTASVGTALAFGQLRCFIAALLVIVAWTYKSGLEDVFLAEHFGAEYEQYRITVKSLIPYVW